MKPCIVSGKELPTLVAKVLCILGCTLFIVSLALWFSTPCGVFFLVTGILLMATGFVVMKKPEYLLLLMGL
jgi:hypothetical protein